MFKAWLTMIVLLVYLSRHANVVHTAMLLLKVCSLREVTQISL